MTDRYEARDIVVAAEDLIDTTTQRETSAKIALSDATTLYYAGDYEAAYKRALDSIRYSEGIAGETYQKFVR